MRWCRLPDLDLKLIWTYVRFERRNLMKLYFYIMNTDRKNKKWNLHLEECEVIEKPKTYRALTKFPEGLYIGYVSKDNIGKISKSLTEYIVLEEPNYQFAKDKFLEIYNDKINRLKKAIAICENKIAAIEDYKED